MKNIAAAKRITNNAFFILIARASEFISGLFITILVARYLGVKDFGIYAFISSISLMLAPVIGFGSSRIIVREVSVNKEQTSILVTSGCVLNGLMSLAVLTIAAIVAASSDLSSTTNIIALFLAVLTQTLLAMSRTVKNVFIAYERVVFNSVTTVLTRLLAIISIWGVIVFDMGFIYLFGAMTAVNASGFFLAFWILHFRVVKIKLAVTIKYFKYLFRESLPVAISVFFAHGYTYINVFFLKFFHDFVQISYFQAPQRLINPLIVVFSSLTVVVIPVLARAAAKDSIDDLKYALSKMMKYAIIVTIPICLCVTIVAPKIIYMLFGDQFGGATVPFQILIWIIIPACLNILLSLVLTIMKKQRVLIISNGICFLINLILGLIIVDKYASVGISCVSVFTYVALATVNFYFVTKLLGFIPMHRMIFRPVVAGSIVWIFLYKFADKVNIMIFIIGFLGIYCGLLILFKTFSRDEIDFFKIGFLRPAGRRLTPKN